MQNATFAVMMPLYLCVHLSTSPTVSSTNPRAYFIASMDLASIPVSLLLGFVVPSILVTLPAPSVVSFNQKQTALAFWQAFPLWVELLQMGTSSLRRWSSKEGRGESIAVADKPSTTWMTEVRVVYMFLLIVAGSTHIATMTLLATSKLFPCLFAAEFAGIFNPSKVFWPDALSSSTKMSSLGVGTQMLLQYDEITFSLALSLWAVFMFTRAMDQKKKFETAYVFIFDFISLMALCGPVGYAVICLWSRDELIFGDQNEQRNTAPEISRIEATQGGKHEWTLDKQEKQSSS